MSINLLEILKYQITVPLASEASSYFGTSEGVVSEVLNELFPLLLKLTIVEYEVEDGNDKIAELIKGLDLNMFDDFPKVLNNTEHNSNGFFTSGREIIDAIIGDNMVGIVDYFAMKTNLGGGTISSLINLSATFLLGKIKADINVNDNTSLSNFLSDQKKYLQVTIPSELENIFSKKEG